MIKRMVILAALSLCSVNAMASNCMFDQSEGNKTYVLEEKTNRGIVFNIYLNDDLKYSTRYSSVSDEYNIYRLGEERIKINDLKMYELCLSPREA